MKTLLSTFLVLIVIFGSCTKDEEAIPALLSGTYVGPSVSRYSRFDQIWTSQYTSYYDWIRDTIYMDFDTLRVVKVSSDSFAMEGPVGERLTTWFERFAWNEITDSNGIYTLKKDFVSYTASEHYTVVFDANNQSVIVDYRVGGYSPGGTSYTFEGSK